MDSRTTRGVSGHTGWGFNMRSGDSVSSSLAGTNVDTAGNLLLQDKGGNASYPVGRVSSAVAAGTALTNSTSETVLGSASVPANSLFAGRKLIVSYQGISTSTNATDTLLITLRCGPTTLTGQALITTAAVDVANNNIFTGRFELTARAAPSAASACVGWGSYNDPSSQGGTCKVASLGSTNFVTNGALLVEVTGTWSVASASNSCRLDVLDVSVA